MQCSANLESGGSLALACATLQNARSMIIHGQLRQVVAPFLRGVTGRLLRLHHLVLDVSDTAVGAHELSGLGGLRGLRHLELCLRRRTVWPNVAAAVAALAGLPELRVLRLNLVASRFPAGSLEALAAVGAAPALRVLSLNLCGARLNHAEPAAWATLWRSTTGLHHARLSLWGTEQRGGTFDVLTEALAGLTQLRTLCLDVGANFVDDVGVGHLARLSRLGALRDLQIGVQGTSAVTPAGVGAVIAAASGAAALDSLCLWLGFCGIGDAGVRVLAAGLPPRLRSLQLDLRDNGITDAGACALAAYLTGNTTLTLVRVHLVGNRVDGDGARALLLTAAVDPSRDVTIDLRHNKVAAPLTCDPLTHVVSVPNIRLW